MEDIENKFIEMLYFEMATKLFLYAKASLVDKSLAEEAVQNTFCDACADIQKLMTHPNPNGWLIVTLKNHIKRTRDRRLNDANLIQKLSIYADVIDDKAPPSDIDTDTLYANLTDNEDYKLLKQYINEQRTVSELARTLGVSVAVCYKRLQRARERLKKYFEEL